MSEHELERPVRALSFSAVSDAYDRARPSYPREAAAWLTGMPPDGAGGAGSRVLELGAGTGKLTEDLQALGHQVLATDPVDSMLGHLVRRLPSAHAVRAVAERIPLRARAVDTVVSGQAFHWFDVDRALPEIARVLRPGGHIALAWNLRDERIPWVKRLGALIGTPELLEDPTHTLLSSNLFGFVESTTFRFWQPLDRERLRELVTSRSNVAMMSELERERVLRKVDDLYTEFGRGHDGMLLPYVTRCYKAVVRPPALEREAEQPKAAGDDDPDPLLIDFQ